MRGPGPAAGLAASAVAGLRRSWAQRAELLVVLLVLVLATTLLGTLALLLTSGQRAGTAAALAQAGADERQVQARVQLADADPADAAQALQETREAGAAAVSPWPADAHVWWSTDLRLLPGSASASGGDPPLGYLGGGDDVPARSDLDAGRWPRPAAAAPGPDGTDGPDGAGLVEAAVPSTAAQRLGLSPGDVVRVVGAPSDPPLPAEVRVRVVGTFTAHTADPLWAADPLGGAGYSPAQPVPGSYSPDTHPAFGPFVLAPGVLTAGAPGADGVRPRLASLLVTADTRRGTAGARPAVAARLPRLRADLQARLAERSEGVVVRAPLAGLLESVAARQAVTASGLAGVGVVGGVLAVAALALAGRLLAVRRAGDEALVRVRGASTGQRVVRTGAESAVLAGVAALAALPLSVLAVRALPGLPAAAATLTRTAVLVVVATAAVLGPVLTLTSLRTVRAAVRVRSGRSGRLARSGADLLLLAAALGAVAHVRTAVPGGAADPLRTATPALALLAGTVLALRVVTLLRRVAAVLARRGDGLLLPLAAWELDRRPATGVVLVLLLAGAAAGSGLAAHTTWQRSQTDQAEAATGADLVAVPASARQEVARPLAAGAAGDRPRTVRPVTDRPVALGTRLGGTAAGTPRLLAVDTAVAGELFRGRPADAGGWASAVRGLAPAAPVAGVPVVAAGDALAVTVTGTAGTAGGLVPTALQAAPTLVVQAASGARTPVPAAGPVPLDGLAHPLRLDLPPGADPVQVVAVSWTVSPGAHAPPVADDSPPLAVTAAVALTGAPGGAAAWTTSVARGSPLGTTAAATRPGGAGTTVTTTGRLSPQALTTVGTAVVATAFPAVPTVPVVLSAALADQLDAGPGDAVDVTLGASTLPARVERIVPHLPSRPRGPVLLADADTVSRALLSQGDLEPLTDVWWAAVPGDAEPAAAALRRAVSGSLTVTTRQGAVRAALADPVSAALLAGWRLLAVAAFAAALAALLLQVVAERGRRAVDDARLRATGVGRWTVAGASALQCVVLGALAVLVGSLVGLLVAVSVQPSLVVSPDGLPPAPDAVAAVDPRWQLAWPALLLAAAVVLAVVPALAGTRRLRPEHLRSEAAG